MNDPEFRILIINSSGNSGKTSTGRGFILTRLGNVNYYRVCNNSTHRKNETTVTPKQIDKIHMHLMESMSAIVEVEISAYEEFMYQMSQIHRCYDDYDFILVPVINSSPYLINNSIRTIEYLNEIGVPSQKIRILFNRESEDNKIFKPLLENLEKLGIEYNLDAKIQSHKYYEELENIELKYRNINNDSLQDDTEYLDILKIRANKYGLSPDEKNKFEYLKKSVHTQRLVLASKDYENRVFDMLFSKQ